MVLDLIMNEVGFGTFPPMIDSIRQWVEASIRLNNMTDDRETERKCVITYECIVDVVPIGRCCIGYAMGLIAGHARSSRGIGRPLDFHR